MKTYILFKINCEALVVILHFFSNHIIAPLPSYEVGVSIDTKFTYNYLLYTRL